jgi:hypothetical protein
MDSFARIARDMREQRQALKRRPKMPALATR